MWDDLYKIKLRDGRNVDWDDTPTDLGYLENEHSHAKLFLLHLPNANTGYTFTVPHKTASRSLQETTEAEVYEACLLYTSPSPRDRQKSRMPSSA